MSNCEALKAFVRKPISADMIKILVSTTNLIVRIEPSTKSQLNSISYDSNYSLTTFIKKLIKYSNVQTPTLMATLVYLNRLRNLFPSNAVGLETTRHRIFVGCLIISAKTLNDSSPLNKHWCKYTDGLISLKELNLIERQILNYLNWDLSINEQNLSIVLEHFIKPIKDSLNIKNESALKFKQDYYLTSNNSNHSLNGLKNSISQSSVPSLTASSTSSSLSSNYSFTPPQKDTHNLVQIAEEFEEKENFNPNSMKPHYNFDSSKDPTNPFLSPKKTAEFQCRPLRLSKQYNFSNATDSYSKRMSRSSSGLTLLNAGSIVV